MKKDHIDDEAKKRIEESYAKIENERIEKAKSERTTTIVAGVSLGVIVIIGLIAILIINATTSDFEKAEEAMRKGDSSVALNMAHQALNNGDIATAQTIQGMLSNYCKKGLFGGEDYPFVGEANSLKEMIQTTLVKTAETSLYEGDFTAAYKVVDILFNNDMRGTGSELNKRILTNEIASIIGDNAGDAAARIVLIIKERGGYNTTYHDDEYEKELKRYEMLQSAIEVAQLNGNKELVDKLEPVRKDWKAKVDKK